MPRGCGCAGNSCSCLIIGGAGIGVAGTGNVSAPYVISLNNQSGYLEYTGLTVAGAPVNLNGLVAGDIVVYINASDTFFVTLPLDAPLGTKIDIIANGGGVMSLIADGGFIRWPAGVDPVWDTNPVWVSLVQVAAPGTWYGEARMNMS